MRSLKTIPSVLFVLIVLICSLSGCGTKEEKSGVSTIQAPLAGFDLVKDVSSLPLGTQLYNGDGKPFGVVAGHDPKYTFPNNKTEKGTKISLPDDAPSF